MAEPYEIRKVVREELGKEAAQFKASVFNASVIANTDIFASDLVPTVAPSIFRIYCCFNASGVLSIQRTKAGTTVSEQLNSGMALTANAAYMFDVPVDSEETINIRYSVNATVLKLSIFEISASI